MSGHRCHVCGAQVHDGQRVCGRKDCPPHVRSEQIKREIATIPDATRKALLNPLWKSRRAREEAK
jgi:hypothetical protein